MMLLRLSRWPGPWHLCREVILVERELRARRGDNPAAIATRAFTGWSRPRMSWAGQARSGRGRRASNQPFSPALNAEHVEHGRLGTSSRRRWLAEQGAQALDAHRCSVAHDVVANRVQIGGGAAVHRHTAGERGGLSTSAKQGACGLAVAERELLGAGEQRGPECLLSWGRRGEWQSRD